MIVALTGLFSYLFYAHTEQCSNAALLLRLFLWISKFCILANSYSNGINSLCPSYVSRGTALPTRLHVRPAKSPISLCSRDV